jgi:flagellar motor component MotA
VADAEPDNYSRKGLQLLVDGAEPEAIRSILEVDFYTQEAATSKPPKSSKAWAATRRPSASSVR